jgi:CheY-like chemotaxis protein
MRAKAPLDRHRVLVAEDEAVVSLLISHLLNDSGFVVIGPVPSTKAALALVEQEPIDCAVLDIKLVDGASFAVADALVARSIPFVIATGYERESIPPPYNRAPILSKVFMPHELVDAIVEILRPQSFARAGRS